MSFSNQNQLKKYPQIKICGNTRFEDVFYAATLGVDYLGFIFSPRSPRYIAPAKVKEILRSLKKERAIKKSPTSSHRPKTVGVFVNEKKENILEIKNNIPLDIVQLHGNESSTFAHSLKIPFWKVFRLQKTKSPIKLAEILWEQILNYQSDTFLLDAYSKNNYGGSGESFNWETLTNLKTLASKYFLKKFQFILAGGLNLENIPQALQHNPNVLDINSGVEDDPGVKNHDKMRKAIKLIQGK